MGIGPISAVQKALHKVGLTVDQMDVIESNEAFAAQACGVASADARGVAIAVLSSLEVGIDADRLTLVLVNLIDNAVKHGRAGGAVFVGVDVSDRRFARLTVDDDGPGIGTADRERVFAIGERGGGRVDLEKSPLGGAPFVSMVPRA